MGDRGLLRLAAQLRAAAAEADRPDVVAKLDEVILLLDGEKTPAGRSRAGVAETVQRILNGLGY